MNKTEKRAARSVFALMAAALVLLAGCASAPVGPNDNGTYTLYPGPKAHYENGTESNSYLLHSVVVKGSKTTVYLISNPDSTSPRWKSAPEGSLGSFGFVNIEGDYVTLINADNLDEKWGTTFTMFQDTTGGRTRLQLEYKNVTASRLILKSSVEGITFDEFVLNEPDA